MKKIKVDTCDLFVCQLSTNDASLKLPIQKVEEAIDFIIDYVREKWDCPIAFYTNPRYESHEYAQMVELIKEKAQSRDIILMNMWDDATLNQRLEENRAYYMVDSIHPTKAGYLELITPFMENFGIFY